MPTSLTRKNHFSRSRRTGTPQSLSIVIPSQCHQQVNSSNHTIYNYDDDATSISQSTISSSPTLTVASLNDTLSDEDDQYIQSSTSPGSPWTSTDGVYSNFYLKLPNGKWRVRCRTGDRKIIGTYEVDGSMI
ncbi:hypothetical protein BCR42DRAFT_422702 [Absidia repens]|uniref:Uncharacterized protein n=1 Tax=Absidia repens TaxID=90262 RepID=A0A1X2I627_9FUNG|nr:hypothetical protein BCR42DRAFT_422702 [Absidia repens]